MKSMSMLLVVLGGLIQGTLPCFAQSGPPNLSQLSIADLMKIPITSASRKEEAAGDVAAAVYVISRDDIRRSGMTAIPDLLRMVPGLDVAQANSNKWAVSIRGFNGVFANKVLVLVDGRSIYNRLFSGVLWDAEDLLLDDVERIEVIRGPGAAMWGANAMNGVINIVTRSAADTQGGTVRVDAGRSGEQGVARYGGTFGDASYRVYTQWTSRNESVMAPGLRANDSSYSATTGFRTDWNARPGAFTLEGSLTMGRARALWSNLDPDTASFQPLAIDPSDTRGGHVVGRWTQTRADGTSMQVQTFADFASRQEPVGDYRRHAFGFDSQFNRAFGARHQVVAGTAYRFMSEKFTGGVGFSLTPAQSESSLVTAFLNDEIAFFGNDVLLTLGGQVQYDSGSGAGVQPTARLMWKMRPTQRVWAATSRTIRTPSLQDQGIRVDYPAAPGPGGLPLFISFVGNPAAMTEDLVDVEAGYRIEVAKVASLDVTGFMGRYDNLTTGEPSDPRVEFVPSPRIVVVAHAANLLQATTRGLEISGRVMPLAGWRLDGSVTAFRVTPELAAESRDLGAATTDGNAPTLRWHLGSSFSLGARATVAVALFHAGPLEQLQVPGYTRTDANVEWRFSNRLSLMAMGQNLFTARHAEFGGTSSLLLSTQVPRSASLRLRWAF